MYVYGFTDARCVFGSLPGDAVADRAVEVWDRGWCPVLHGALVPEWYVLLMRPFPPQKFCSQNEVPRS